MNALLEVEDLGVSFSMRGLDRVILHDVSFGIGRGESLGLVGESGSGKSVTARTVMGLIPDFATVTGSVRLAGRELLGESPRALRELRIRETAMIFQDPRAHINPVRRVGDFLTEAMIHLGGMSRDDATGRALGLLASVGIPNGADRMNQYPHQLSGGLLQRIMIASALAMEPSLLLADEPTTALDVTTQEEVMAIVAKLREERELAVLLITHDLELAAATCERTAVMREGEIVEIGASGQIHDAPRHPYTQRLLAARPDVDAMFAVDGGSGTFDDRGGREEARP